MQRFIPLTTFKSLYINHTDLLSDEGMEDFDAKLNGEEGRKICEAYQITTSEFEHFKLTLKDPENIVFYGWVSYNTALLSVLTGNGKLESYDDAFGHLIHQLSEGYQRFLSPYLSEKLLRYAGTEDQLTLAAVFSFVELLDNHHRAVVENQLFGPLNEKLEHLKVALKGFQTEQELIDYIKPLCSEEMIDIVNYLSKASYALKLNYVDQILLAIRSKACTVRFANWILKQMELVKLNREHEYKILDLRRELKSGELSVQNHGKGRTPIRWRNAVMFLFLIIIGGGVTYLMVYKPFSDVEAPELSSETSFKQFSKEERAQIDSLLREMDGNIRSEDLTFDQSAPIIGNSATLTLREPFENENMEAIYQDLIKDAEIQEQGFVDSCATSAIYVARKGDKDLTKNKGTVAAMIRNDSDFDAVIYVAEDTQNGAVHSMFLKQGATKVFEFNKGDIITVVAGNSFQKYVKPNSSGHDLPSKMYTHHFCETDPNFRESINTSYRLSTDSLKKVKFLLAGNRAGYFQMLDLKNVLEAI